MSGHESTARSSTLFGNYDIIETLGSGGMGVVYRAHDVSLGRIVAVKVLKDDLRVQRHVVARFQREAQAIASLNHPNIVHVHSVGSVGRIPYMAMEYVEGEPLNRVMHRERKLDWEKAFDIGIQVAKALACAHEAQIIHRDVKPGNIIIGTDGRAVVTDFGVAKVLTAETQLTMDGSRLGTPQYMSPERCLNKPITASSDLYSLGVLLFQLIAGRLPYRGRDPIELIRKIVSEPPARLGDFADVPEDVERMIAHMIEKDPDDRPASAEEVVDLLTRVREGEPLYEEDSGFDGAIEELRDALSTPTTGDEFHRSWSKDAAGRLRRAWGAAPQWSRTSAVTALLMAIAALVGVGIADRLNADFATGAVGALDSSVAHWHQPVEVADFIDEAPGVLLARLRLPDFEIASGGWMDNGSGIVLLQGTPRSARYGQTALCAVDPVMRSATLCVAPLPAVGEAPAIELMAFSQGPLRTGSLNGNFLFRLTQSPSNAVSATDSIMAASPDPGKPDQWLIHNAFASSRSIVEGDIIPQRVDTVCVSPDGETIVLALSEEAGGDEWFLAKRKARLQLTEPVYTRLSGTGPRIVHAEFSKDGSRLIYMRDLGRKQRAIWVADLSSEEHRSWLLLQGDVTLNHGAINSAGDALLVSMPAKRGRREIRIVDIEAGEIRASLGEGGSAAWSRSGDLIVFTALDLRGRLQLFTIAASYPHTRTQLTHLDEGVTQVCTLSVDGEWVFSGAEGAGMPTFVFARLPD